MILKTLRGVLFKPGYLFVVVTIAITVFLFAVWTPNTQLIIHVMSDHSISTTDKAQLLVNLVGSIKTNFTLVSASYTIIIAVLFGLNVALITYYIRRLRGSVRSMGSTGAAGFGGLISGILGIGCAACGSFILTSALTLVGAGGVVALLPFGGEEFGFLGVALLTYSIYVLAKKINEPLTCEIT